MKTTPLKIKFADATLTFDDTTETLTITPRFNAPRHNKKHGPINIPYEHIGGTVESPQSFQIIIKDRRNDITVGMPHSNPMMVAQTLGSARKKTLAKIDDIINTPHPHAREFTTPPIKKFMGTPLLQFGGMQLEGESIIYGHETFPIAGATATFTSSGGGGKFSAGGAIIGGVLAGGVGAMIGGTSGKGDTGTLTITLPNGRTITATGGKAEDGARICNDINQWG